MRFHLSLSVPGILVMAGSAFACTPTSYSEGAHRTIVGKPTRAFPVAYDGKQGEFQIANVEQPAAPDPARVVPSPPPTQTPPSAAPAAPLPDVSAPAATPPATVAAVTPDASNLTVATPQRNAYAFIVGVEHYRELPSPGGARADAEAFADVAKKTLGIPDSNVRLALDDHASRTDLLKGFEWLKTTVTPGSRVYFFYSGHGAPDPTSGASYLVPYDGDPQYLHASSVLMSDAIAALTATKARDVFVMVDSCFSGAGGRSVLPPGARPLVRVREATVGANVAMLTSSGPNEISGPARGGSHGVFSKYLLSGLGKGEADADGDGQITLDELFVYVRPRVTREAHADNRDQTPTLIVGRGVTARDVALEWGIAK